VETASIISPFRRTASVWDPAKKIPEISIKMFTQTVRELEKDGLIQRTVYPEVPPRVDYTLTPEGQSLDSILKSLDTWGKERFML